MRDLLILAIHLLVTVAKLLRPGGARAVVAESLLLKHQLLISNRSRRRAPNLTTVDRFALALTTLFMFNYATSGQRLPKHLSTDNDPLFRFHRWLANLRVLEIDEIKSVPYIPVSHPFVERLIGTIRREYLDRMFFWNGVDLGRKLGEFKTYYNGSRCHQSLNGGTPMENAAKPPPRSASLVAYDWQQHCRGLFQTPGPA